VSIETFITRAVANKQVVNRIERETILTLCNFADLMQMFFKAETLKKTLQDVEFLTRLRDGQAAVNSDLRKENERLKKIDNALRDFNFEKATKQREDFAREALEEVRAARQRQ